MLEQSDHHEAKECGKHLSSIIFNMKEKENLKRGGKAKTVDLIFCWPSNSFFEN